MSSFALCLLLSVWQRITYNWTIRIEDKVSFSNSPLFQHLPPPPPLPHGDLVFQAEEKLRNGRRAGRSPSNLCCYYKQGWPGTPHHMASHPIHFMAALLVVVNQWKSDVNWKKLIFMLWTGFIGTGLEDKRFSNSQLYCFCHSAPNVWCMEPAKLLWRQLYVAGRRWGRVLPKSKYERRQTDRWRWRNTGFH